MPDGATHQPTDRSSTRPGTGDFVALALLLPAPSLGTAAALILWPDSPFGKTIFLLTKVWILVVPLFWRLAVERQRISWSPPRRGGFGVAAVLGLIIAGLIGLTYIFALRVGLIGPEVIAARAARTGLDQFGFYLTGALYWITANSLMEEYVWRWFVFRRFEAILPAPAAVIATSAGFTAHHIVALSAQFRWPVIVLASAGVFIGGVVWSWLYLRFRSIWPCYLSHAIVDAPIFLIGYDLIFLRGG